MTKDHGNYLAKKRPPTAAEADKQKTLNHYEEELVEAINKLNNENYKSSIKGVSQVVACFRTVTKYIRKSSIAKEKLETIQPTNSTNVVNVEIDIRWNSTLCMLLKFVRLKCN